MSTYSNRLQPALQNQLQCVVRFFHLRSSCTTMHILTDVQRITLNVSCMTVSGGRTKQLDIFCCVTGFTSDFLSLIVVELIRFFHRALQFWTFGMFQTKLWLCVCVTFICVLSAPEVLGPEKYDTSCDMWSLGVITYILSVILSDIFTQDISAFKFFNIYLLSLVAWLSFGLLSLTK